MYVNICIQQTENSIRQIENSNSHFQLKSMCLLMCMMACSSFVLSIVFMYVCMYVNKHACMVRVCGSMQESHDAVYDCMCVCVYKCMIVYVHECVSECEQFKIRSRKRSMHLSGSLSL